MSDLRPDSVLYRAPDLRIHLRSDNSVAIAVDGHEFDAGSSALRVLEAFAGPTPVGRVVAALGARSVGALDWMDLTGTIVLLRRNGALLDVGETAPRLRWTGAEGFDAAPIHTSMLNDRGRTGAYLEAIRRGVREGDVVVDLGTGTGILAAAAARAGARRVYAIEASGIGTAAEAVFEANGVADRVTLVRGWSMKVRLPERADVLVSEIVGNEPFGEMILESLVDAVRRMLKPEGRMIPREMGMWGIPVTMPEGALDGSTFTPASVDAWTAAYGIDLGPLRDFARRGPLVLYRAARWKGMAGWPRLAPPVRLVSVDFARLEAPMIDAAVELEIERPGRFDALLVYFMLDLGEGLAFSAHPDDIDETFSWRYPVWLLGEPFDVEPGDAFRVHYKHAVPGARDRLAVRRA